MKCTVLTLSNGRYDEFKNAKRIEAIGSVRFDTEKYKIVGFGENKRQVEVVSRFLSVAPITRQYPELTPYQFASNTPIQAIDLDGLEAVVGAFETLKTTGITVQKLENHVTLSHTYNGNTTTVTLKKFDADREQLLMRMKGGTFRDKLWTARNQLNVSEISYL